MLFYNYSHRLIVVIVGQSLEHSWSYSNTATDVHNANDDNAVNTTSDRVSGESTQTLCQKNGIVNWSNLKSIIKVINRFGYPIYITHIGIEEDEITRISQRPVTDISNHSRTFSQRYYGYVRHSTTVHKKHANHRQYSTSPGIFQHCFSVFEIRHLSPVVQHILDTFFDIVTPDYDDSVLEETHQAKT